MRQKHNQIIYSNSSKISFHSNLAKPIQVETFRFAHILANDFVHMTFNIIFTQNMCLESFKIQLGFGCIKYQEHFLEAIGN